jgi:hypothetical protein
MMLRVISWVELSSSVFLLALTAWPVSDYCSGRPGGFDCESWYIFGINFFGPLGFLALVCSISGLMTRSLIPQYFLMTGFVMLLIYWLPHVF